MTSVLRDIQFGVRMLWSSRASTAIALLALALGIAANSTMFSMVYATVLGPLPYPNAEQLTMVWSSFHGNRNYTAAGDFLEWKRESAVFQDIHAWTGRGVNLSEHARPERVEALTATPGFYTMLGLRFLLGRDFLPEEGRPGQDRVLILRYQFWQERFGGDRTIIGRTVRVDGTPHVVVGVLAPGPVDRGPMAMAVPLAFTPDQINHNFHWLHVTGRLRAGTTLAQANEELKAMTRRLAETYPVSNTDKSARAEPFRNNLLPKETLAALWLLLGVVGFVLLIACANVANLLLARGTTRQRELAVRMSLGASRMRLFRQLLTESLVLALTGGALGAALATVLLDATLALLPPETLPWEADVALNVPVLLFTCAVSAVSGVLFGCLPAWQAMRANLNESMKDAGRAAIGGRMDRLRRALVVAEMALALALLAGGGLAIRSFMKLSTVDLGFSTTHLLTFALNVPQGKLTGAEQITGFYQELLEKLRAIPGVRGASVSTSLPVRGPAWPMWFSVSGGRADPTRRPSTELNMVTPEYLSTLGIQIVQGRALDARDGLGGPRVAIVNEALVARHLGGLDPLAQRLLVGEVLPGVERMGPPVEWQIVGVYRTIRTGGPRDDGESEMYVPFAQSPWPQATIALRTAGDPGLLQPSVAAVIRQIDPDLPMTHVRTMEEVVRERMAWDRFKMVLFAGVGAVALLLAAFGIYGVMSFMVAQRTREIGLRMALGAAPGQVLRHVLREGLLTAFVGMALGSVGAYLVGRVMQRMWYGVGAIDPLAFGSVAVVLLGAAVLACVVPARRASRLDPLTAIRRD